MNLTPTQISAIVRNEEEKYQKVIDKWTKELRADPRFGKLAEKYRKIIAQIPPDVRLKLFWEREVPRIKESLIDIEIDKLPKFNSVKFRKELILMSIDCVNFEQLKLKMGI